MRVLVFLAVLLSGTVFADNKYYVEYDRLMSLTQYYSAADLMIKVLKQAPSTETAYRIGKAYHMIGDPELTSKALKFLNAASKRGHEGATTLIQSINQAKSIEDSFKGVDSPDDALTREQYIERVSEIKRYNENGATKNELLSIASTGTSKRQQFKVFVAEDSQQLKSLQDALSSNNLPKGKVDVKTYLIVSSWAGITPQTTKIMEKYPSIIMDVGGVHAKKNGITRYPGSVWTNGLKTKVKSLYEITQIINNMHRDQ